MSKVDVEKKELNAPDITTFGISEIEKTIAHFRNDPESALMQTASQREESILQKTAPGLLISLCERTPRAAAKRWPQNSYLSQSASELSIKLKDR